MLYCNRLFSPSSSLLLLLLLIFALSAFIECAQPAARHEERLSKGQKLLSQSHFDVLDSDHGGGHEDSDHGDEHDGDSDNGTEPDGDGDDSVPPSNPPPLPPSSDHSGNTDSPPPQTSSPPPPTAPSPPPPAAPSPPPPAAPPSPPNSPPPASSPSSSAAAATIATTPTANPISAQITSNTVANLVVSLPMTVNDFNAQAQSNFIKAVASSTGASTSSVQITGITVLSTRRRLLSPSILVHFSILAKDAQAAASIKNSFSVESLNKELIKNGLPQASLDLAKSSAGASNNTYLVPSLWCNTSTVRFDDDAQYLGIGGGIFLFAIVGLGLWRRLRKNRVKTVVREPRPEVFGTGILRVTYALCLRFHPVDYPPPEFHSTTPTLTTSNNSIPSTPSLAFP
eukprot:766385-Hanusia_phi.AAC.2